MLLYGVAIATGPFQCNGMWSVAGSWGVIGDVGVGMGGWWVRMCVKKGGCELPERKERVQGTKIAFRAVGHKHL